jgi:translocator protein
MKSVHWNKLIISLAIPQIVGGLGALVTTPKIQSWYLGLNKPFFSPPNWVFGPVWTLLFLLMGFSLYLVWTKKKKLTSPVFNIFWLQLFLNLLWSVLFFGLEMPFLALFEIVFLWLTIRKMTKDFPFQIPYLCWVSFATLLNAGIWWLNR